MVKYVVSYVKRKFLHYEVEADNAAEAEQIADETEEKFGIVIETPYYLTGVRDADEAEELS